METGPPPPQKNRRTNRAGLFSFSPPPGMLFSLQLDTNRFLFIAFFFLHGLMPL